MAVMVLDLFTTNIIRDCCIMEGGVTSAFAMRSSIRRYVRQVSCSLTAKGHLLCDRIASTVSTSRRVRLVSSDTFSLFGGCVSCRVFSGRKGPLLTKGSSRAGRTLGSSGSCILGVRCGCNASKAVSGMAIDNAGLSPRRTCSIRGSLSCCYVSTSLRSLVRSRGRASKVDVICKVASTGCSRFVSTGRRRSRCMRCGCSVF